MSSSLCTLTTTVASETTPLCTPRASRRFASLQEDACGGSVAVGGGSYGSCVGYGSMDGLRRRGRSRKEGREEHAGILSQLTHEFPRVRFRRSLYAEDADAHLEQQHGEHRECARIITPPMCARVVSGEETGTVAYCVVSRQSLGYGSYQGERVTNKCLMLTSSTAGCWSHGRTLTDCEIRELTRLD